MGGGGHHHHRHGGGHRRGGGGWGWGGYPYPAFVDGGGPTIVIDNASNGCVVTDSAGIMRVVPCALSGDDDPVSPAPLMRTAMNLSSGPRGMGRGSNPYYRYAASPRSFPFDWNGRPGGVPQSRVAGETRELSGADLVESGGGPYGNTAWPPLASRNFRLRPPAALSGLLDGLSDNEAKVAKLAAAGTALYLLWRKFGRGK